MSEEDRFKHTSAMYGFIRFKLGKRIPLAVEVGTRYGHWARGLLDKFDVGELYCIDLWSTSSKFVLGAKLWLKNVGKRAFVNAFPLRGSGHEWAQVFPRKDIDLLFVDGCHSAEAVNADLTAWWPKVRKEGLVLCHDAHDGGVRVGVALFFKKRIEEPKRFLSGPRRAVSFWVIKQED